MLEKRTMELKSFLESNSLLQTNFKVSKIIPMSDNFPRKSSRNYIDRSLMKNDGQQHTMFVNIVTSNYVFSTDFVIKALRGGKVTSKDECLLYNEELGINEWVNFNKVAKGDLNTYIQKHLMKAAVEHNDYVKQKQEQDKKQKEQEKVDQQGIKQLRKQMQDLKMDKQILETQLDRMDAELQNAKDDVQIARIKTQEAKQELAEVQTKMQNIFDTINDEKTYTSLGQQITKLTKTLEKKGYAQKVIDKAVADAVQKWTKKSLQF